MTGADSSISEQGLPLDFVRVFPGSKPAQAGKKTWLKRGGSENGVKKKGKRKKKRILGCVWWSWVLKSAII